MEKGTQFRVNTIEELEQAYKHFRYKWYDTLNHEKEDFKNSNIYRYILKDHQGYMFLGFYDIDYKTIPNPLKEHWLVQLANDTKPNKYAVSIKGVELDIYDILYAHNVRNPALQHLIKKCLHGGMRGHKSREQDLKDIIASAKRAHELEFKND
jgi:hypothetical protein